MNTEPTKSQIKKWCNALRSGKYKQGKGRLQRQEGYCCLGVACHVFIPKNKIVLHSGLMDGYNPDDQPSAPIWLDKINDRLENISGKYLTQLNDNAGFTFDEIADVLEAVYIHEVLKK